MSCEVIVLPDGARAIVCTRAKRRQCRWCGKTAPFACDAPRGKRACNAPMCAEHAREVGPDTHHCPEHRDVLGLFSTTR